MPHLPPEQRAPAHAARCSAKPPAERSDAFLWTLLLLGAALVLVTARMLTPSPTGVGTHQQLGLPGCLFLAWTKLPCPACGLTTAFSHLAHGELTASLRVHPLGVVLFALTLACVPTALYSLLRGKSLGAFLERLRPSRAALLLLLALTLAWLVRI